MGVDCSGGVDCNGDGLEWGWTVIGMDCNGDGLYWGWRDKELGDPPPRVSSNPSVHKIEPPFHERTWCPLHQ